VWSICAVDSRSDQENSWKYFRKIIALSVRAANVFVNIKIYKKIFAASMQGASGLKKGILFCFVFHNKH